MNIKGLYILNLKKIILISTIKNEKNYKDNYS